MLRTRKKWGPDSAGPFGHCQEYVFTPNDKGGIGGF